MKYIYFFIKFLVNFLLYNRIDNSRVAIYWCHTSLPAPYSPPTRPVTTSNN